MGNLPFQSIIVLLACTMLHMIRRPRFIVVLTLLFGSLARADARPDQAADLNPVTLHDVPKHDAITLIDNGQPRANLCLMGNVDPMALEELQRCLKLATGAE